MTHEQVRGKEVVKKMGRPCHNSAITSHRLKKTKEHEKDDNISECSFFSLTNSLKTFSFRPRIFRPRNRIACLLHY